VPNDGHAQHENTFLHYVLKQNHKWVKLKSDKGRLSQKTRRAHIRSFCDILALKGLTYFVLFLLAGSDLPFVKEHKYENNHRALCGLLTRTRTKKITIYGNCLAIISKNIHFQAHSSAQKKVQTSLTFFVRSCALMVNIQITRVQVNGNPA